MSTTPPRGLRLRSWWLSIGWALLVAVVYLSLTPTPPRPPAFAHIDKLEHLLAYFVLMSWFAQIEFSARRRRGWLLGLIALGGMVELLQGWGGVRDAEWGDWLADGLGVALGWWLARTAFSHGLLRVEAWLLRG